MRSKITLSIISLIVLIGMSSCGVNARIRKADRKYAIGEYYEASEMYRQVYRRISSKDRALRAYFSTPKH